MRFTWLTYDRAISRAQQKQRDALRDYRVHGDMKAVLRWDKAFSLEDAIVVRMTREDADRFGHGFWRRFRNGQKVKTEN